VTIDKLLWATAGVACIAVLFMSGAYAQTRDRWLYDSRGNHVGTSATDSQDTTRYYDSRGNHVGTSYPEFSNRSFMGHPLRPQLEDRKKPQPR
jgi:hypothetical protein